ncbi:serine hydrolase domain-containing protein [Actinophytocola gossypii]|uniref:Beta-lactamase family protein n=1 Tax=Actinophytocola gossypii TaxID=2812003 RepID=A0ABT2JGD8_9PSEU|nr:serine hydrolase domain-containing protein [Actinophytocola gossypii]MCT2586940.1 beta-lactamase family protein [Actinophytocola gossypii]
MLSVVLLVFPAPVGQPPGDVTEFLADRMAAVEAPGMSYALVNRDRIVSSGAWGTDGHGRPMTTHTPVGFGSVAKPVTAVAVMRLVDAGTVGLDDPVFEHLPWFRLADRGHAERITVRHLLEQTSGLAPADGYARSDIGDNEPGALRRWVESLAETGPNAAPGERHQYNPANAQILGAMVEEVSGLTFAEFLHREVLGPLDMADAVADAATAAAKLPPGHEFYFGGVRVGDAEFDTSGVPYGYLAGSVTDLAHLAMLHTNDGRFGGREVLSERAVRDLRGPGPRAGNGHYGLSWRVDTLRTVDTTIVWHAGASPGYHTVLVTAPDTGWAVAVQQNVWSPLADPQLNAAALGALTIALGGTPDPPPGSSTSTLLLAGMGALVLVLAAGLGWTARRAFRRCSRRPWLGAVGWGGLGAIAALGVGVWLPGAVDLTLRHILLFLPDVGQLAVAAVVLGSALVLARLVLLPFELRRRPGTG